MILKGNQRSGARNLAAHLLSPENEHVEVHEVRGFSSETVTGAFNEAYAMSRGTKCKQFLFSLSVNPPQNEAVTTQDFESAIDLAEERLGLVGQPRAIVFHEKNGRRHAHAVWSRIDTDEMKAVQLSFTHKKLQQVSRELYLEHGWKMPRGLTGKNHRDPINFTLAEWQQAKRQGKDPSGIKTALQDAWASSDSKKAFIHALKERGYALARGDRRGYVAVDRQGEIYSLGKKWLGVKTNEIRDRLGKPEALHDIQTAKQQIAVEMRSTMDRLNKELAEKKQKQQTFFEQRKQALIERQQSERKQLFSNIEARRIEETKTRQERFRDGVGGLWDKISGKNKRIRQDNEYEAYQAHLRDRAEKDSLIFRQLDQRRKFNEVKEREEERASSQKMELTRDVEKYDRMQSREKQKQAFIEKRNVDTPKPEPAKRSLE